MLASRKVSIVIPCYNQAHHLQQSVRSALKAYSGPLEIIIVDDGSTDSKTPQYLEAAKQLSPCIRVIRKDNGGASSARNAGIESSTGDFVQLLDSDDIIIPDKIDEQISHLECAAGVDVSICECLYADSYLISFDHHEDLIASHSFTLQDFLYRWERGLSIPIHCALFRREAITRIRWSTVVRPREDWIFWTSLVAQGTRLAFLPIVGAVYRVHERSMCRTAENQGSDWLRAALEIESQLAGRSPEFLRASVNWFNEHYSKLEVSSAAHDHGRTELAASGVASDRHGPDSTLFQNLMPGESKSLGQAESDPLISVVVPIFNHFRYLETCLSSILQQGAVDIEIVCVNDASTDSRVQPMLEAFKHRVKECIVLVHDRNAGIAASQNEAVQIAKGEYIAFLDCDDYLMPGALETITKRILESRDIDYFFSDRLEVDDSGEVIRHAVYGGYEWLKPSGNIKADLLDGMIANHLKVVRRECLLETGGFDTTISGVQDWDLALKIADKGGIFEYLQEPLYAHRIHGNSVTLSDFVGQFRRTNVVRRRYQGRWYNHQCETIHPEQLRQILQHDDFHSPRDIFIFRGGDRAHALPDLKQAWAKGNFCVMDARGQVDPPSIWFVREFNSYLDCILWDLPETFASLVGYCWKDDLLHPVALSEPGCSN